MRRRRQDHELLEPAPVHQNHTSGFGLLPGLLAELPAGHHHGPLAPVEQARRLHGEHTARLHGLLRAVRLHRHKFGGHDAAGRVLAEAEQLADVGGLFLGHQTQQGAGLLGIQLSEQVGYRLRRTGYYARTLTIKVRYPDFKTLTRSKTTERLYTDWDIYQTALALYNALKNRKPVRLLGVQVSNFTKDQQLSFFNEEEEKRTKLADLVDRLNDKYGKKVISSGIVLRKKDDNN